MPLIAFLALFCEPPSLLNVISIISLVVAVALMGSVGEYLLLLKVGKWIDMERNAAFVEPFREVVRITACYFIFIGIILSNRPLLESAGINTVNLMMFTLAYLFITSEIEDEKIKELIGLISPKLSIALAIQYVIAIIYTALIGLYFKQELIDNISQLAFINISVVILLHLLSKIASYIVFSAGRQLAPQ